MLDKYFNELNLTDEFLNCLAQFSIISTDSTEESVKNL